MKSIVRNPATGWVLAALLLAYVVASSLQPALSLSERGWYLRARQALQQNIVDDFKILKWAVEGGEDGTVKDAVARKELQERLTTSVEERTKLLGLGK